jgi:hypothetical protein
MMKIIIDSDDNKHLAIFTQEQFVSDLRYILKEYDIKWTEDYAAVMPGVYQFRA